MLRLTLDLVPYGVLAPERIGLIEIGNDGTGGSETGTYVYRVHRLDETGAIVRRGRWRRLPGEHRRADGAWVLVGMVLAHLAKHPLPERAAARTVKPRRGLAPAA